MTNNDLINKPMPQTLNREEDMNESRIMNVLINSNAF